MTENSKNMTIPRLNQFFCLESSLSTAFLMIWEKRNNFIILWNHEYDEADRVNSV